MTKLVDSFVIGCTSQQGRRKLKYKPNSHVRIKNVECGTITRRDTLSEIALCQSLKRRRVHPLLRIHDYDNEYTLIASCNNGVYESVRLQFYSAYDI